VTRYQRNFGVGDFLHEQPPDEDEQPQPQPVTPAKSRAKKTAQPAPAPAAAPALEQTTGTPPDLHMEE
jgi:hypothetical protein